MYHISYIAYSISVNVSYIICSEGRDQFVYVLILIGSISVNESYIIYTNVCMYIYLYIHTHISYILIVSISVNVSYIICTYTYRNIYECMYVYILIYIHIHIVFPWHIYECMYVYILIYIHTHIVYTSMKHFRECVYRCGEEDISYVCLFCRISSLSQGSFAKEMYNLLIGSISVNACIDVEKREFHIYVSFAEYRLFHRALLRAFHIYIR